MNFNVWSSTQQPINNNNNNDDDDSENGCLCASATAAATAGGVVLTVEVHRGNPPSSSSHSHKPFLLLFWDTQTLQHVFYSTVFSRLFFVPIPTSSPLAPPSILDYIRFIQPRSSTSLTLDFINVPSPPHTHFF